jgi:hypothetical protein
MTVLSRGARVRRGGRRPGWVLLTALLVLAMGASSALVFTNRVELLKLAVILALWAAVAGAFVSVLYRRQSDADQSRVRDMKLVYDLQLDREISARREYELTVESQLRRELASELRAAGADDVAALRAELSALRTRLEILFDTDLDNRPALEGLDPEPSRAYTDWSINGDPGPANRVSSDRVTSFRRDSPPSRSSRDEASIIDVPEEPLIPPRPAAPPPPPRERRRRRQDVPPEATPVVLAPEPEPRFEARHRPPQQQPAAQSPPQPTPPAPGPIPMPEPMPSPATQSGPIPAPAAQSGPIPAQGQFAPPPPRVVAPHQPEPAPQQPPPPPVQDWQPAAPEGQWLPAGTPGSNWSGSDAPISPAPAPPPEPESSGGRRRRAQHEGPDEVPEAPQPAESSPYADSGRRSRSRHSTEYRDYSVRSFTGRSQAPFPEPPPPVSGPPSSDPAPPRLAPPGPPAPAARHRGAEPEPVAEPPLDRDAAHSDGQSVADLMARLGSQASEGGRRRRRDG